MQTPRDENRIATLLAVSNVDGRTPVTLWADPTTHRLLVDLPASGSTLAGLSDVTITTPLNGQVLSYDTATSKWINSSAGAGDFLKNGTVAMTGDLDFGQFAAKNMQSVRFDVTPSTVTPIQGQMYWNATEGTISANLDTVNGVTLDFGAEQYIKIKNVTGVQINNGQVVYINGVNTSRPTAALARADVYSTSSLIGMATQNIANGATGFVTTMGIVHDVDTNSFVAGDMLYVSAVTAGAVTNVAPTTPNFQVMVGQALDSLASTGSIFIKTSMPVSTDVLLSGNSDDYMSTQKATKTYADTKKYFHGVLARPVGASSPLPTNLTTTTFTLGATANPITYYYQGTKIVVSTDKTTTLSGAAGLYFIYFNAATGNIANSTSFPGISDTSNVILATVSWNGTNYGLINDERHGYARDCTWHYWAHSTIGTRYKSGINFTPTGTGATSSFTSTSGELEDEDIPFVFNASSAFPTANALRLWWQDSATTYTFDSTPSTQPYKRGTGDRPVYINSSSAYAITTLPSANNRFVNYFIYGTTDNHTPLYCFAETQTSALMANGYTSLALARAIPFPNLAGLNISPELKALYRLIVRADGVVQAIDPAQDDYRTASSIPMSGGNVSTTASAVSFTPYGNISSATVQTAIQELDDEKAPLLSPSLTTPTLGDATATTINKVTITAPATSATLTITNGKTVAVQNSLTLAGTDSTTMTFPTTSATIARTDAANTFTGVQTMTSPVVNTGLELGNASDTTITRVSAGVIAVEGVTVPTISSASTLTNKRIDQRVVSAASYTTDTGTSLDVSTCDLFVVTAQAGALKLNNPSGTPVQGQKLMVRIKDNGTARALTYDTQFRAMGVALPSTTVLSKTMYLGFIYNSTDTKWDLVSVAQEA